MLFREALLHGRVLSQGDLLYSVFPWRAAIPEGLVIGNRLLADIPLVFYPFLTQVADVFATGTFPLWSTRLYTGHPFFASFQSALLSPFTWIAVAVPLPWGTVAGAAARVATGGVGALLFARRIGLGWIRERVLRRGVRVQLVQHHLARASVVGGGGMAALAVLGGRRRRRGTPAAATAVLAGVVALTVFAGHPETALKVLACGGLYGLARAAASARPFRAAAWVTFAYALGLLLSAVQVVPFAEDLQVSRTQAVRASITVNPYALPRRVAVGTMVPDFWGHPVSQDYVAQTNSVGAATNYAEQQTYPGVATWVLACVGLATVTRRRWRVWFFAMAALLSAALAFGTPSPIEPLTSLPVLRMTLLSRFRSPRRSPARSCWPPSASMPSCGARTDPRPGCRPRRSGRRRRAGGAIAAALWAFRGDLTAAHLLSKATAGGLFSAAVAA